MRIAVHASSTSGYDRAVAELRRAGIGAGAWPRGLAAWPAGDSPDAVVTDLCDDAGRPAPGIAAGIRQRFPGVPVIAYMPAAGVVANALLVAGAACVSAAALYGVDDLATVVRHVVEATNTRHAASAALGYVEARLSPLTRPIVAYCLTHAPTVPDVADAAAALGVTRKTVAARLAREGLPAAGVLIGWGRVLAIARRLEDPDCPVEAIALALRFDGGPGLRHLLARYTGLRPADVRAGGGLPVVLPLFAAALDRTAPAVQRPARRTARALVHAVVVWALSGVPWEDALAAALLG